MAVGASGAWIRAQFLVEAALLSVAGGLVGLAAGIAAGRYLASSFGFPALIRTDIVVLAIAVSGLVGIAFGFYPAHKASKLDPITALRYE
jgi:putative ABC transport system permease protein